MLLFTLLSPYNFSEFFTHWGRFWTSLEIFTASFRAELQKKFHTFNPFKNTGNVHSRHLLLFWTYRTGINLYNYHILRDNPRVAMFKKTYLFWFRNDLTSACVPCVADRMITKKRLLLNEIFIFNNIVVFQTYSTDNRPMHPERSLKW